MYIYASRADEVCLRIDARIAHTFTCVHTSALTHANAHTHTHTHTYTHIHNAYTSMCVCACTQVEVEALYFAPGYSAAVQKCVGLAVLEYVVCCQHSVCLIIKP
jgi:hypothetical protein